MAACFFERFRAEVARYAEGVHRLGPPAASAALVGVPAELADFLRSFDGAELFVDAFVIHPAAGLCRDEDRWIFGETATGDALCIGPGGAVLRVEADSGETLVEGTSFARWIEALCVAEAVLHDREGEFKEGVFDETGEELAPAASERRERLVLKLDPDAPAPTWRLARAVEQRGRASEARVLLERLVAGRGAFGWAWFDLARLRLADGDALGAEAAYASAADADPSYEHAGYFVAHAARVARMRGDEATRVRHAARARELDPEVVTSQKRAGEALLEEGAIDEALVHLELAAALAPRDVAVLELLARARAGAATPG
ncbi:MAG: hypothetical protein EXR73_07265 [Myxococcales bacterium]|nr:hypothetical protein [Myxococcales bacterium]